MRNIRKPATSGNHSAASGDAKVKNRGRHLATDQPIDRFRGRLLELYFSGSRGRDRGSDGRTGCGLPLPDRDLLAGKVGHRFDLRTRHQKSDPIVGVVCRHGCGLFGIAGLSGFGTSGRFGVIRFLSGGGGSTRGRQSLRERRRGGDLLKYRWRTGSVSRAVCGRGRDVGGRRFGDGSRLTCRLQPGDLRSRQGNRGFCNADFEFAR